MVNSLWHVPVVVQSLKQAGTYWSNKVEVLAGTKLEAEACAGAFVDDHLFDITPDPFAVITVGGAEPAEPEEAASV